MKKVLSYIGGVEVFLPQANQGFKAETASSQNGSSDGPWEVVSLVHQICILLNEQIADPQG